MNPHRKFRSKQGGHLGVANRRVLGGRSDIRSPAEISGLVGWWKQGDWISASEAVSQWNDSSGITFEPYIPFQQVSGQTASTPDTAANSITGDISIIQRVAMADWTPASVAYLLTKRGAVGQYSWMTRFDTTGTLTFVWSADGTVEFAKDSTANLSATADGAYLWLMYVLDVDNGAAGHDVKFYTAPDSATIPTSWTQLGSTVTTAGVTSIFNSTSLPFVGSAGNGFIGRYKRGLIYSGIVAADGTGGTLVNDLNPSIQADGATSWVSTSPQSETWTLAGGISARSTKALRQMTGANQPIELPWSGENYIYQPQVASNQVSSANKTVTGNLRIEYDMALNDWTQAGANIFALKFGSPNGFLAYITATGAIRLDIYDGVGANTATSAGTPCSGFANFSRHTVRIDWEDGVGATFWVDGVQSGSQVALAKTLTNASTPFVVAQGSTLLGKIYSFSVNNGAGTTYYAANISQVSEGATSFSQNGDTFTVTGTGAKPCQIVGSKQILGDGAASFMRAAYTQAQPVTRFVLLRENTWTSADYLLDGVGAAAGVAGWRQSNVTPGVSINAVARIDDAALNVYHVFGAVFNGASSFQRIDNTTSATADAGSTTAGGMTLMADASAGPAGFSAVQVKEIIEYSRALSSSEITQVLRYLNRIGSVGVAI